MNLEEHIHQSKAVFFDLFHTLFSFKSDGIAGVNTSELLGIPEAIWNDLLFESSEQRLRGLKNDRYEIIRELAHSYDSRISEETIRRAADLRAERFSSGLKLVGSERIDVLKRLRSQGKKIGLISNADSVEVSGWKDSPLSEHFDSVVFSYATGYVKPEPGIYRIALECLGVAPHEAAFVGDGGSDELRGAKEVGMTTVMTTEIVSDLWPEKIPARAAYADYVISNLRELLGAEAGSPSNSEIRSVRTSA